MDDDAACLCPLCGNVIANGHPVAPIISVGARVEVHSATPAIVGTRVGRFDGYLPDGRVQVSMHGETFVLEAGVVAELRDLVVLEQREEAR